MRVLYIWDVSQVNKHKLWGVICKDLSAWAEMCHSLETHTKNRNYLKICRQTMWTVVLIQWCHLIFNPITCLLISQVTTCCSSYCISQLSQCVRKVQVVPSPCAVRRNQTHPGLGCTVPSRIAGRMELAPAVCFKAFRVVWANKNVNESYF